MSADSLVSCIIHVSGVTTARKPEVVGSNPAFEPFPRLFRYLLTRSFFVTTKIMVFSAQTQEFLVRGLFLIKNYSFSHVTETKCSFWKIF